MKHARHKKSAKPSELPQLTSCMSAVRYVLKKALKFTLPTGWVGDMPYMLFLKDWRALSVETDALKAGDLIFVGKKIHTVGHIALVLKAEKGRAHIFHSSGFHGKPLTENVEDFIKRYPQGVSEREQWFRPSSVKELLSIRDERPYFN